MKTIKGHDSPSRTSAPLVLAMTGASGAPFAVRLLQQLVMADKQIHCVASPSALTVIREELGIPTKFASHDFESLLTFRWPGLEERWGTTPKLDGKIEDQLWFHHHEDFMAPIASGSYRTSAMIICPCSGATMSGIVHAAGNNLIQRAADVHLKEQRKLILVPRETPLSVFQLENMHRAAQAGAIVMPAMPGWYHGVTTVVDLIDFIVARILDHLEIEHSLMKRWGSSDE